MRTNPSGIGDMTNDDDDDVDMGKVEYTGVASGDMRARRCRTYLVPGRRALLRPEGSLVSARPQSGVSQTKQLISQRPAGRHHKIDSKMTRAEEELEEPCVGC